MARQSPPVDLGDRAPQQVLEQLLLTTLLDAADAEGIALVVATHDDRVAARLSTRWSIRDGRLETGVAPSSR